jgi:tetratricopeptide (TPR) repeat protein
MSRFLYLFLSATVLFACGGKETTQNIYYEPPFVSLTDSIENNPKDADLHYRRGVLFYRDNHQDLALKDIRQAWTLNPDEEYALSITTLLKEKNADSAIQFLQQAIKQLPKSMALKIGLARGYQAKGQTDQALAITNKIIEQNPDQLDALTLKSELVKTSNQSESIAIMEKAYSLVPSDPQIAYDLAFEYAETNNVKTLKLTDSLIKAKAPEPEKAFYIRGLYYANTGNTTEAIKNYDEAIRRNYNFLDAYRDKGQIQLQQKQYDAALKTFELGLKVDASVAEFYYWIAKINEAQNKKAEAKLNYKKAYELDKNMAEAKEGYDRL